MFPETGLRLPAVRPTSRHDLLAFLPELILCGTIVAMLLRPAGDPPEPLLTSA